ncbi:hypothetical protein BBF93_10095 [Hyphomonas sp. CACIAM 19H1]|uniref:PepSY domain-containing protein n=1 Tax=Hyphomonas sp. CACIAM 19H1 TaxID=1873716 RepID=UPI000DED7522|nr:PepSY domain-containing protein [Hyphomonas sp. CACIAM 19H1]AXE64543.1 hypothetical protein BBF93_10095 [Hyphomonas sp. CACIAM 19H1]
MKSTPYVVATLVMTMIAAGTIGAGKSAAQTETGAEGGMMPTPARYAIGHSAGLEEASRQLAEQGFEVIGYEAEGRRIEVTGLTATGHCLELKFHPSSGKETSRKRTDDCSPRRAE